MFKTVRAKLILSYVAIVALFLLLALGGSLIIAQDITRASTLTSLHQKSAIIDPLVQFEVNNSARPIAQTMLARLRDGIRQAQVRVLIVNGDTMTVQEDTSVQSPIVGAPFTVKDASAPDLYTAQGAEGTFTDQGTRYLYVARYIRVSPAAGLLRGATILGMRTQPVSPDNQPAAGSKAATFMVVVAQPEPQLRSVVQGLFDFFGRAGVIALLVSLVVAFLLARSISRPISRLAEAAAAMARGDYSQRVQVGGQDEIATLSRRFNEMAEEVERAHHMERDFVANVSHDLKTPLTSIQGFSQAMMDGSIVDEGGYRQAASIINSEAERMNRLVTELLSLSRLQNSLNAIALEPSNLAQLLDQTVTAMQPQAAQAGVTLRADGTNLPCVVMADGDKLKQAFGNLIDNALKHTPQGGSVTISLQPGAQALVTITDTGQGIPPEDLPRVMERFYQVDKSRSAFDGRSAGLGLAIAREIVRAHDGELSVHSEPGRGTTVQVVIPAILTQRLPQHKTGVLKRLNGPSRTASTVNFAEADPGSTPAPK